jgi:hypothetical protein
MGLHARVPVTLDSSLRGKALGVVDTALSFATRRQLFTADEAMGLLRGVRNQVGDPELESLVEAAIAAAAGFGAADTLVDRANLIDRLLDLRLAMAG